MSTRQRRRRFLAFYSLSTSGLDKDLAYKSALDLSHTLDQLRWERPPPQRHKRSLNLGADGGNHLSQLQLDVRDSAEKLCTTGDERRSCAGDMTKSALCLGDLDDRRLAELMDHDHDQGDAVATTLSIKAQNGSSNHLNPDCATLSLSDSKSGTLTKLPRSRDDVTLIEAPPKPPKRHQRRVWRRKSIPASTQAKSMEALHKLAADSKERSSLRDDQRPLLDDGQSADNAPFTRHSMAALPQQQRQRHPEPPRRTQRQQPVYLQQEQVSPAYGPPQVVTCVQGRAQADGAPLQRRADSVGRSSSSYKKRLAVTSKRQPVYALPQPVAPPPQQRGSASHQVAQASATAESRDHGQVNWRSGSAKGGGSKAGTPKPQAVGTVVVTLHRQLDETLGIGVAGGRDRGYPPVISCLKPGSLAARSDQIMPGDKLITVNAIDVRPLTHGEIYTLLRAAGETVKLELEYGLEESFFMRPPREAIVTKTVDICLLAEGRSFGFTIRGGAYGPDQSKARPLTVTSIRMGGPADRECRLRVGDRLLSIDGIDVRTATLAAAHSALQKAAGDRPVSLSVEYDCAVVEPLYSISGGGPVLLEIDKPPGTDFGIELEMRQQTQHGNEKSEQVQADNEHEMQNEQGTNARKVVHVKNVWPASIADRCGAIHCGDTIQSIDGTCLDYTTVAEAGQLLHAAGGANGRVRLELAPGNPASRTHDHGGASELKNSVSAYDTGSADDEASDKVEERLRRGHSTTDAYGAMKDKPYRKFDPASRPPRAHSSDRPRYTNADGHITSDPQKSALDDAQFAVRSQQKAQKPIYSEINHRPCEAVVWPANRANVVPKNFKGSTPTLHSTCSQPGTRHNQVVLNGDARSRSQDPDAWRADPQFNDTGTLQTTLHPSALGVPSGPNNHVSHTEVMHVSLTSGPGGPAGPGIVLQMPAVATDAGYTCPPVIGYIEKGSPAEKCGALQPGDRVLAINEWSTMNAQQCVAQGSDLAHEANRFLRAAALAGPVTLTVEFDVLEPPGTSLSHQATCTTVKLRRKAVTQSLGIVLAACQQNGSVSSAAQGAPGPAYKGRPVVVADVRTGSVAHRSGVIRPGDIIVAIDLIPLAACTIEEAGRLLQRAGELVNLAIIRDPPRCESNASSSGGATQPCTSSTPSGTLVTYSVELSRRGGPLGVTIASTDEPGAPIVVSAMAHGGLAARAKALRVGDRLLAINGQSVTGRRVSEAMDMMRSASDTVTLKLCRYIEAVHSSSAVPEHRHSDQSHGDAQQSGREDRSSSGIKSGTPVQSIDSAVESLEESPVGALQLQQQPHASGAHGHDGQHQHGRVNERHTPHQRAKYVEELHAQLQRLNTSAGSGSSQNQSSQVPHSDAQCSTHDVLHIQTTSAAVSVGSHQRQGSSGHSSGNANVTYTTDSGLGSAEKPNCHKESLDRNAQAKEEWMRVLEALETVGEAEMLRKLEQSILEGSVPNPAVSSASTSTSNSTGRHAPPFPVTNTILRHPYNSHATTSSDQTKPDRMRSSTASLSDHGSVGSAERQARHYGVPVAPPKPPYPQPLSPPTADQADSLRLMGANGNKSAAGGGTSGAGGHPAATGGTGMTSPRLELRKLDRPALFAKLAKHAADEYDRRQNPDGTVTSGQPQQSNHSAAPPLPSRIATKSDQTYAQSRLQNANQSAEKSRSASREFRVTLYKDREYNDFGFSVSDGENESGVFVNKIRPGGPADRSGVLRPCDRILQVNNTSVAQLDCILAVPVLLAAADRLDMLLIRENDENGCGVQLGKTINCSLMYRDDGVILEEDEDSCNSVMVTMKDSAV